ncbi:MAG TPA: RNA 2',3'-cyclic phosphodiesterase [Rhodanobacteraceae bacterium]|nr:RNA 2',3'-cyclic phosphodiesterase [Rhodanobacteraceae bacterium]
MSGAPAPANFDEGARCFIALLPDAASVEILLGCQNTIADSSAGAARRLRWVERNALHLTLRFLGPAARERQERLAGALPALARSLGPLATRRFGIWPNRARPRLLVLELAPDATLEELARGCEAEARATGFASETRPFRSHVTLARLRPGCAFGQLPAPPPAIAFHSIALMQSNLIQPSATYRELHRVSLG